MQGRIIQRTPGSWTLYYDLPRGADGKRKQKCVTVKGTRKDAEKELRKRLQDVDSGLVVDSAKGNVGDHLEKWLRTMRGKVEPTTYEGLEIVVRAHLLPYWGKRKLESIKPEQVRDWVLHLEENGSRQRRAKSRDGEPRPLAGITVNRIGGVFKQAMEEAVDLGILARNPAKVRLPPPKAKKKRILTQPEIELIMRETRKSYLHALILLGISTGCRRGELLGLRWKDVNLQTGEVTVARSLSEVKEGRVRRIRTKGTKTEAGDRTVYLPEFARRGLVQHKARQAQQRLKLGPSWQDHDLIVCGDDGAPIRPSTASVRMKQMMGRLGLERITLHGLRHSFASMVLASGANLKTLQTIMGHENLTVTIGLYGHLLGGEQEEVAKGLNEMLGKVMGL